MTCELALELAVGIGAVFQGMTQRTDRFLVAAGPVAQKLPIWRQLGLEYEPVNASQAAIRTIVLKDASPPSVSNEHPRPYRLHLHISSSRENDRGRCGFIHRRACTCEILPRAMVHQTPAEEQRLETPAPIAARAKCMCGLRVGNQ